MRTVGTPGRLWRCLERDWAKHHKVDCSQERRFSGHSVGANTEGFLSSCCCLGTWEAFLVSVTPSSNGGYKHYLELGEVSPAGERSCEVIFVEGPGGGTPDESESLL